jgi:DNA-binding transcriptional ArsR family regulator
VRRGYARISDDDPLARQLALLEAAGCQELMIERGAGEAAQHRLEAQLEALKAGDDFVALGFHSFGMSTGGLVLLLDGLAERGVATHVLEPFPMAIGPDSAVKDRELLQMLVKHEAARLAEAAGPVGAVDPGEGPLFPSVREGAARGADKDAEIDLAAAAKVFAALSQPIRLAAFIHLVGLGPAGAAAETLGGTLHTRGSALTLHLRTLEEAGLVCVRQNKHEGRERALLVTANVERLGALFRLMFKSEARIAAL